MEIVNLGALLYGRKSAAGKNLSCLPAAVFVAQTLGKKLGRSALLQRTLPQDSTCGTRGT